MDMFVLQLFNGLSISSILLLIALGLAVTFGLMNVINMAHGELIMIGAYATYVTQNLFISYAPPAWFDVYFIVALPIAFGVAALIGWLLEVVLIRHLYGRPLDSLLATWGVGMMLQQLARTIFGAPNVGVSSPAWLNGGLTIADGIVFPYKRIFIIVLVAIVLSDNSSTKPDALSAHPHQSLGFLPPPHLLTEWSTAPKRSRHPSIV